MKKYCIIFGLLMVFVQYAYADEVENVIDKAKNYQSQLSVKYDVTEIVQDDLANKTTTNNYSVLKKGVRELIKEKSGNIILKEEKKQKQLINNSIVEAPSMPPILDLLLAYYKNGVSNTTVTSKDNTIIVKGKKDDISFKAVFSQNPVLLLEFESKNKGGDKSASWKFNYDFRSNTPILLETTQSSRLKENEKFVSNYTKTLRYQNYKQDEKIIDSLFSEETLKSKQFPKLKDDSLQ